MSNPRVSRVYGLSKFHKDGMPIRPVIPLTYYRTFYLKDWFKGCTQFTPEPAVLNSADLVNRFREEQRTKCGRGWFPSKFRGCFRT